MSLSDEIRNFDSCASDYIREDWAARIEELEAEIQQLKKEIQLLLTGSTEFVDKEG